MRGAFPKALKSRIGEDMLKRIFPKVEKPKPISKPPHVSTSRSEARMRYTRRKNNMDPAIEYTMSAEEALQKAGLVQR